MKQNYPIVIILVLSLLIGILTLTHYGESWDDLSLQKYAAKSLDAYRTWTQQGVVEITEEDLGNYGPSYVMAVALGTHVLNAVTPLSLPDLRHLFYFITYLAGVWAFYALGTRWLTRNAALGATLLFITQPLLWGHAFMNPKDTPFLAFFLLSVFFGFKMADYIKPLSFDSLTPSAKKTLTLLTALWLVSVFPLFIFTDAFHAALTSLVHAAQSGETNIISLIASDIHTAAPEIYIQKYFTLFIHARAIYFLLFTSVLLYVYYRLLPSSFHLLAFYSPSRHSPRLHHFPPHPWSVCRFDRCVLRTTDKRQTSHTCFGNLCSHCHHRHVPHLALSLDRSRWTFVRKPKDNVCISLDRDKSSTMASSMHPQRCLIHTCLCYSAFS